MPAAAEPFEVGPGPVLRGDSAGEGDRVVVLCHGITATRGGVLHGSRVLERAGFRVVTYDARGHGESDPAPVAEGYGYPELVDDLERVVGAQVGADERFLLAGSSMGAHTAAAYALRRPQRLTGLVVIGPAYPGEPITPESEAYWDGLADALEDEGIDGFVAYIGRHQTIAPEYRDSVLRFTRDRMSAHRDLGAVAQALRETPRSRPFGAISDLAAVDLPALVVASGDEADPGHPYAVAAAYAGALPQSRMVSEGEGESPLAWQGGKLSREIASFAETLSWSTSSLV
jgi:pimeloyl-ACP methyl ester carboxylesterase